MQNHYAILGLPKNADQELIKATYKALLKIYHPDVFKGDNKFATEQLKKINIAYEILSDPKKRKNYDAHHQQSSGKEEDTDDFSNEGSRDERTAYQKIIAEEWKYAIEFYPELKGEYEALKKLSQQLAFNYQVLLIEGKLFDKAVQMAEKVKEDYLTAKFSSDKDLKTIAEILLITKNKKFALELNMAIKKLGPKSKIRILQKLKEKYPVASKIYRIDNYTGLMGEAEKVQILYFEKDQSKNSNYEKKQNEAFKDRNNPYSGVVYTESNTSEEFVKVLFGTILIGTGLVGVIFFLLGLIFFLFP